MIEAQKLKSKLNGFIGTEGYHRFSPLFSRVLLTDGAKYLADQAECYWLMDVIGSIELKPEIRDQDFLTYRLQTKPDKSATFTADDGNGYILSTQDFGHTTFPLDEVELFGSNAEIGRVVMLPTEY